MRRWLGFLGLCIGLLVNNFGMAQHKVESFGYRTMLNNLLSHSVKEISVDSLARTFSRYTLLDARAQAEFKVSHIKGAKWVGYENFELSQVKNLPKDQPIVVYCSVGYRSEQVAEQLEAAGYRQVYNLYGGIFEWLNQEKPIYNPQGEKTLNIHAYSRMWGFWLNRGTKIYP